MSRDWEKGVQKTDRGKSLCKGPAARGEPGLSEKNLKEFRREGARRPKASDELRRAKSWATVRTAGRCEAECHSLRWRLVR